MIYVRFVVKDSPVTVFLDLLELSKFDAESICQSLIENLLKMGFNLEYLEKFWVGFASDGANVMIGKHNGIGMLT